MYDWHLFFSRLALLCALTIGTVAIPLHSALAVPPAQMQIDALDAQPPSFAVVGASVHRLGVKWIRVGNNEQYFYDATGNPIPAMTFVIVSGTGQAASLLTGKSGADDRIIAALKVRARAAAEAAAKERCKALQRTPIEGCYNKHLTTYKRKLKVFKHIDELKCPKDKEKKPKPVTVAAGVAHETFLPENRYPLGVWPDFSGSARWGLGLAVRWDTPAQLAAAMARQSAIGNAIADAGGIPLSDEGVSLASYNWMGFRCEWKKKQNKIPCDLNVKAGDPLPADCQVPATPTPVPIVSIPPQMTPDPSPTATATPIVTAVASSTPETRETPIATATPVKHL